MFVVQKTIKDRQSRRHSELGKMTQSAHKTVDFTEQVAASAAKGEKDISDLKHSLGETASDTNKLDDELQQQQATGKQLATDVDAINDRIAGLKASEDHENSALKHEIAASQSFNKVVGGLKSEEHEEAARIKQMQAEVGSGASASEMNNKFNSLKNELGGVMSNLKSQ